MTLKEESDRLTPPSELSAEKQSNGEAKLDELESKKRKTQTLAKYFYVLAGFVLYLNTSGLLNIFGVYQAYYRAHTYSSSSPSAISWIGSTQVFIGMAFGIFTGPLYDRGYLRPFIVTGSFPGHIWPNDDQAYPAPTTSSSSPRAFA